jgi:hypothetical protein
MICFYSYPEFVMGGFFLSSATNVFNFSIGTILQRSTLGYCNLNTYEDEEVAFIEQRIGEPLKWRHIRRIVFFLDVKAMSALPFQGVVIFRTFVPDSGFGTYAMLTAMVILP